VDRNRANKPESPAIRRVALAADVEEKSAISILLSRIQAPEHASVPKRLCGPALALPGGPMVLERGECARRVDYPMWRGTPSGAGGPKASLALADVAPGRCKGVPGLLGLLGLL
jgi:hypothetical protein